jgi:hypothetical protein
VGYGDRQQPITDLERIRGSRVICYFLSDRETFPPAIQGFSTNMAGEPHLLFLDLLKEIGRVPQIDLFLYTRGGITESVWPMVTAIREHCDRFSVLVPFRAHSGGTLLCLGADEVVMSDGAQLSPIDPTTGNQFNPTDPADPGTRFGISVEDVFAYFKLSEDLAEIKEQALRLQVFQQLANQVHPLALGNVQRVYQMIRTLAQRLLALHMADKDAEKMSRMIQGLTTEFYSHLHAISRDEARELLGEWVRAPSEEEAQPMDALFETYAEAVSLRDRFNLPLYMGDQSVKDLHVLGGLLETSESSFSYTTDLRVLQRPNLPPGVQVQVPPGQALPLVPWVGRAYDYGFQRMGWVRNNDGE